MAKNENNKKYAPKNPKNGHSTKSKGGRPPIQLCEKDIEDLAALGCTDGEIAGFVSCAESTLQDRFSGSIKKGRSNLKKSIRKAQLESAIKDRNTTMLIWLGKIYCKQNEKSEEEDSEDGPIHVIHFGDKEPKTWNQEQGA